MNQQAIGPKALIRVGLVAAVAIVGLGARGGVRDPSKADSLPSSKTDAQRIADLEKDLAALRCRYETVSHDVTDLSNYSPPVGSIQLYAGVLPDNPSDREAWEKRTGWLFCDGRVLDLSNSEFKELAEQIRKTYDPEGKRVKLPDTQGRMPLGVDRLGGLTKRSLGERGGSESHNLTVAEMPAHDHAVNDPGHGHLLELGRTGHRYSGGGAALLDDDFRKGEDAYKDPPPFLAKPEKTGITIELSGGGQPHSIMNPFIVFNYIIKYK
jgi:microcystin-dependent protein